MTRLAATLLTLLLVTATADARADPRVKAQTAPLAMGDLDGDGRRDGAVVIERSSTGGLAEVYLAVFAGARAGWRLLATVRLDDGAVVERLRISTGRLTAAYRRHYPVDEPGQPTNATFRSWAFADGRLHGGDTAPPPGTWERAAAARLPR
jgi:hypothetical protein